MFIFVINKKSDKMASKYLQIAFADAKFFEYAKEEKEGFVEHINNKGEKKGFRKYYDTISGTLESIRVKTNEYLTGNPEEIQLSFKERNGDYINLDMMLLDMNKDYSTFVESFLIHLPNLIKGEEYWIQPYNFKNERDKTIAGLSIRKGDSKEGEKVVRLIQSAVYKDGTVKEGDIPAVVWTTNARTGKPSPDSEAKFMYLKGVLEKGLEKFKFVENSSATSTAPSTTSVKPVESKVVVSTEDDGLPF